MVAEQYLMLETGPLIDDGETRGIKRRLGAILFADVVEYSRMMGEDEVGTRSAVVARAHLFQRFSGEFSGEVVQMTGDGLFLLFDSAVDAVAFAVKIQKRMEADNRDLPESRQIRFRIGINLGEIIFDDNGPTGDSVNIAARLEPLARPGQICISASVYEQVRTRLTFGYEYLGEQTLKNIAEPVDVFQVHEDATSAIMTTGRRRMLPGYVESVTEAETISIVVLPFQFRGSDESESWFADGLTEDITTSLSRFHHFSVISRASAFVVASREIAPSDAARQLGVRYSVFGSVRKSGPRIRIAIQLQDAISDRLIWGEQYDRVIDDIFDLQDEITQTIVAATAVQIEAFERERLRLLPPANMLAYGYVLQGQQHIFRYTRNEVSQARALYDQALQSDPGYARAMAAKSRTHNLDWRYDWSDDPDHALDVALDLAMKAIDIDRADARAFGELGYAHLYRKEHDAAIAAYRRALSLNPNDADLMSDMADALAHSGESEQALELLQKAMRLNPYYPDQYLWHLAGVHYNLYRYEDAVQAILGMQNPTEGRRVLAASYAQLGRIEEARATAELVRKAHPTFDVQKWAAVQPDRLEEETERFKEGLIKAGL